MFDYQIKIAENKEEKEKAFKLRFEVFKEELGKSIKRSSEEKEWDIYDEFCDHLIVMDRKKDIVVGTYRLLLGSKVNRETGFYSERFFDIENIKRLGKPRSFYQEKTLPSEKERGKEILELGRSCVHRDYRERPIINLLWNGIAKYIRDHNVGYLFGPVRLMTTDPKEVSEAFSLIKEKYYAPEEFRCFPLKDNVFRDLDLNIKCEDPEKIFRKLPPLVKGYLRLGVKICSPPARNPDFDSVIFLILLDIEKMTESYRKHFLEI